MSSNHVTHSIGFGSGTLGLLGIVFAIAKLCGVIDWSWWIVLLPIYLPFALGVFVIVTIVSLWVIANISSPTHY